MPRRKGGNKPETEVIQFRIPVKTKQECLEAKDAGAYWSRTDSEFYYHLLEVGLRVYEKTYLPIERRDEKLQETPTGATNQIPHPKYGVVNEEYGWFDKDNREISPSLIWNMGKNPHQVPEEAGLVWKKRSEVDAARSGTETGGAEPAARTEERTRDSGEQAAS